MEQEFLIPKLAVSDLNFATHIIIDVRSPMEFEKFSIPESVNVDIFNNEERAKVGTIYKQESKEAAVKVGLVLFGKKLPDIYETVLKLKEQFPKKSVVVTCARGGMRSTSVVSTLNMLGVHCYQLVGGMRSHREFIVEKLDNLTRKAKKFYVVSGNTGTRKTEILQILKGLGFPVLDFEGLAAHRGSVFGGIGLKPHAQKQFEALLVEELGRYERFPYYIIEAESKRVGNIVVPDYFMSGKENGTIIELKYPFKNRIEHLLETYQPKENHDRVVEAFQKIKKRFQGHVAIEIEDFLATGQYDKAFSQLLTYYYDPMYAHANNSYHGPYHLMEYTYIEEAVDGVKAIILENEQTQIGE